MSQDPSPPHYAHVLILDDERPRHDVFAKIYPTAKHVYTYEECVTTLATHDRFDLAQLDHDLVDLVKDGYEVARFIASMDHDQRPRSIIIHSVNPFGRARMFDVLTTAGIPTIIRPFPTISPQASK